jgi:hypothetical protein
VVETAVLEEGDVVGSNVKELGALGDNGGVSFVCCNDEEGTGEVQVSVAAVVVGIFPTGALDLR